MLSISEKTTTELEKIFTNHISHKDLVSRMYNEFLQLNNKKLSNPTLKDPKVWTDIFLKKTHQWPIST